MTLEEYQKKQQQGYNYHLDGDALYNRYRDLYTQNARRSMQDTMGQAASLTGGYGNTYAQSLGQQRYDETMRGLVTDVAPQIEQQAYSRYRDALNDQRAQEQLEYTRQWNQDERDYTRQRQAAADLRGLIAIGYNPSDAELAAAGMSRQVADLLRAQYTPQVKTVYINGGSPAGGNDTGTGNTLDSDVGALKAAGLSSVEINRFISQATAKGGEYGGTSAKEKARIRAKYGATAR